MGTMKIYILHGWTYSTEKWDKFIGLLKKEGFYAEMLKMPGLTVPLDEVWDLDQYVKWLKRIADKEKKPVILLGHSNGGRISLAFAHKYPEKVEQLILIDSAGIYHNDLPIRVKRLFFKSIAKIGKKFSGSEKMRLLLYKFARESDYQKADPVVRKTMTNLITVDLTQILSKIKTPALFIWGEKDQITPLKDGEIMHRLLKNSKMEIVKDARHSPMFTHPEEVVDIIIKNSKIQYPNSK